MIQRDLQTDDVKSIYKFLYEYIGTVWRKKTYTLSSRKLFYENFDSPLAVPELLEVRL